MHPYQTLGDRAFWATAVGQRSLFDISGLWEPKFRIDRATKVATFGSCFAQHIGRALRARGFNWKVTETAPPGLLPVHAKKFNYGVFTARTGNIYTVSLLKQWIDWASGSTDAGAEVWHKDGRTFDPFRPNIEPEGFGSEAEMLGSREMAIDAFCKAVTDSDVFVFTLGLTESWFNRTSGREYPMCPGTVAGEFDAANHEFLNQDFPFIRKTLAEVIRRARQLNPDLRFLLTVSPVPLTATMSGNHVLVATMESKSILRAVAAALRRQFDFVDYFPSYEIITAPPYRGTFFEPNQRSINPAGVDHVMRCFFEGLSSKFGIAPEPVASVAATSPPKRTRAAGGLAGPGALTRDPADIVCEEELLEAFSDVSLPRGRP